MWSLQLGALQSLGPLWAPDLPGFGAEPPVPPPARSAEAYADWVAAALRTRGSGPHGVAGYSMGGSVALLLALRHPDLVARLALCCCSPRWGRGGGRWVSRLLAGRGGYLAAEVFQLSVRWAFRRSGLDGALEPVVADMTRRAHRPTMATLCRSLARLDLRPALAGVACPTLVVGGTRELLVPASHHRRMARAIPRAELRLFRGAGHVLCVTRAGEFSAVLRGFFRH